MNKDRRILRLVEVSFIIANYIKICINCFADMSRFES